MSDERGNRLWGYQSHDPGPKPHSFWPDDGLCRGHGRTLCSWRICRPEPLGGARMGLVHRGIACLFAMNFTSRRSVPATVLLLGAFGILMGLATAPLLAYYATTDPAILWQAGGATALFIAGFGSAGYAIRRDLSALARVAFFALLALIIFGIVLIFVHIPQGDTDLRDSRPGHLRRHHDVRLSAPPALERRFFGPADGGLDLPRYLECVLVLSPDLRREQLTLLSVCAVSPRRRRGDNRSVN